jgi:hypothetical protein
VCPGGGRKASGDIDVHVVYHPDSHDMDSHHSLHDVSCPMKRPKYSKKLSDGKLGLLLEPTPVLVKEAAEYFLSKHASEVGAKYPWTHVETLIDADPPGESTYYHGAPEWRWEVRFLDSAGTTFEVDIESAGLVPLEIEKTITLAEVPKFVTDTLSAKHPTFDYNCCGSYEISYRTGLAQEIYYEFDSCLPEGATAGSTTDMHDVQVHGRTGDVGVENSDSSHPNLHTCT